MIHEDTRDVKKETKKLRSKKIKIKQNKMRICSSLFNVGIYCSICYQINRRFTQQKNSLRYEKSIPLIFTICGTTLHSHSVFWFVHFVGDENLG